LPEEGRRETWDETVDRFCDNVLGRVQLTEKEINECRDAIVNLEVMPSMRAIMTAGKAADRDNTSIYNCSYLAVDSTRAFDEAMFILLCGTGVGFSVEKKYTEKLPQVPSEFRENGDVIVVPDSKEGWARSFRKLVALLYTGDIPKWDTSKVRPAGSRLETFGGRASGAGPLEQLFIYTIDVFKDAAGRQLTPFECHSIMCKVGEVVVVGGVRRSAMISLSDLQDDKMREAKSGNWWETRPEMALANNSVSFTRKPDMMSYLDEWTALVKSGSGERGIFNREASQNQVDRFGRRDASWDFGTNPCSEIVLRPNQFCNLSEVVVREGDTVKDLKRKVRIATILGTVQATFTHFPYLRSVWKKNTADEALLGVSLTGIMDNELTANPTGKLLNSLRDITVVVNDEYSARFGIQQSASITCVKPSGTVSQLVDAASGIHTRHSDYYIRTIRGDKKDPLTRLMIEQGIPAEDCVMKPDTTTVFSFPVQSPKNAITRDDRSALEQLETWKTYALEWCEHKPSVTISVRDHEWMEVGAWVYKHFDIISGISFLPHSNHTYQQAPYQECTKDEYLALKAVMPEAVDWSQLSAYESEDNTSGSQTLACSGDACEVVDLT
tara:strand:- start:298 stop:2130 length:1833 start_codon:yes stop_codon:yes gene_type:complete